MPRPYGFFFSLRFPALLLSAAFLSGCDHNDAQTGPAYVSLDGAWSGSYETSGNISHPISLTVTQTVNVATGSYQIDGGVRTGTLQGSVDGNNATLTLTPIAGCSGSLTMITGTQSNTMQIFLNGTDCHGTISNGTGSLTRT